MPTLRWSSLRFELFWVYEGLVAADNMHTVSDHRHGYWVWLLRQGKVSLKMGKQVWNARVGQWMVSPHGSTIQDFSSDASILSVHFRCQWPTGENLFVEQDGLILEASDFPRLGRSASRLQSFVSRHFPGVRLELLQRSTDYPIFLKVQQRFLQWLIDFYDAMTEKKRTLSRGGGGDERLWRAAECLHTASLEHPFPTAQLQRETSLGRAQLDRLFLKEFGTTMREYWEQLRQEAAISSLETSKMSIKEICYCLGFRQPSHFTKWFSRRMEVTPQDYRMHAVASGQFKLEADLKRGTRVVVPR